MLLDVLGTTLHAIRRSGVAPEHLEAVCIMGAGPIGQGAVIGLRGRGVAKIFVVDINPSRLEMAAKLGAHTLDGRVQPQCVAGAHADPNAGARHDADSHLIRGRAGGAGRSTIHRRA